MQQYKYFVAKVPSDVIAASLQLLDARDLLMLAVGLRRPLTDLLPRGWEYQARRPLTTSEHEGLLGVGVPRVQLWSECATKPDTPRRFVLHWTYCRITASVRRPGCKYWEHRIGVVVEDARGALYRCRDESTSQEHWELISEAELDTHAHMQPGYLRESYFEQRIHERQRRLQLAAQPPQSRLLLTNRDHSAIVA